MAFKYKRIAAIHDLSCFGRSSLTVVMPLFAKMGIQVCPIPTAILSTHGAYENGTYLDLTNQMLPIINHWKVLNLEFDAIYSGFLGSSDQIEIVLEFIEKFSANKPLIVVDPVMGDNGNVYSIIDSGIIDKMEDLVKRAHIITPNMTEAYVLLKKTYKKEVSMNQAKKLLKSLSELGPNIVVLTSIHFCGENQKYTGVYDKSHNQFFFDRCEFIPQDFPGTGDAFTSVLIGAILNGFSIKDSLSYSLKFIEDSLKSTINSGVDPRDGINLEEPQIRFNN